MFVIEYDEETRRRVLAEESREEGREKGREEGREEGEIIGEIKILLSMGQSKQAIIEYLTTRGEKPLTPEQAETAFGQYLARKRG